MNEPTKRNTHELEKHYLRYIHKFDFLEAEEEFTLAKKWRDSMDPQAASRLISAHMRLVVKIASGYRHYGLPLEDLVSEGHIGILQALKKFEPARGFRFSTYAMWWIKAQIQHFILNSWSLVKLGQSAQQRKLFFNLRRLKNQLGLKDSGELEPKAAKEIAEKLKVSPEEVVEVNKRLSQPDHSLNQSLSSDEGNEGEWQDFLVDEVADHEAHIIYQDEVNKRSKILKEALNCLAPREHKIFTFRRLKEPPATLDELSKELDISKERVRQIEVKSFLKIQAFVASHPLLQDTQPKSSLRFFFLWVLT